MSHVINESVAVYVGDNELESCEVPIHRKRIGPGAGGGLRAFIDFEARPFWELGEDDLIDTSDLCQIFGTSLRTVYRWMSKHSLKPVRKVGREFLFRKGDVLSWYELNRPRPGRPSRGGRR